MDRSPNVAQAMDGRVRSRAATNAMRAIALSLILLTSAFAQTIQLSPAQQQMLDALPPAQRQQALIAIQQLQAQQSAGSATQSINEIDDASFESALSPFLEVDEDEEARAESRSRLVINFTPFEELSDAETLELEEDPVLKKLIGSHLFVLDEAGVLMLPGLDAVPLLGLDEEDIRSRLSAETYLSVFDIDARILGQEPIGVEALEPFGYDVLEPSEQSFDPPGSGPVPPDYVLGPGDSVRVQLFGNLNGIYEHEVSRDGILNLPEIGPVTVAGIPFSEFRADINNRVQEMLIGTQVSVTMGPLRSIRVFVLGDVNKPGSYVIGGLSTISSALYRSGGVNEVGTLRDIQLKRNGRLVARLDLYDLLINGDNSGDRRLQPGDVIFVPPIGNTIAIAGAVKRPAIYETRRGTSVADAVRLAGGLAADAFGEGARLERIDENRGRKVLAINLGAGGGSKNLVRSGDTLIIPEVLPDFDDAVILSGHVHRPGNYSWQPGMHLTDLIGSVEELRDGVDMNYVLVRRERVRGRPIETVSADLEAALLARGSSNDIKLEARDQVYVFSLELGRQRIVEPIIEDLQRQATHTAPSKQVQVGGNVRVPGIYPLEGDMRVSDLVRAGGSLSEEAYALEAELTRYSVSTGDTRVVEVIDVDLAGVLRGDASADVPLAPYDYLRINEVPEWDSAWTVTLDGEVRFPGDYRIRRGETLAEVLQRAGGVTNDAFIEGSVFLRETLREREQEQMRQLASRLESDLASLALQQSAEGSAEVLSTGQTLLEQLRDSEAVGRLVISIDQLVGDTTNSLEMRDGDQLLVPKRSQVVTVIGETQQNTSHLYSRELKRDDYINLSGGLTRRADKKRIYVVRASGAVEISNQSRWLGRGGGVKIWPGDTIVVPLDADKMRPLTFWTSVSQIIYQGAIAVAAVNSF